MSDTHTHHDHLDNGSHHHHSHTSGSQHVCGHHLLQVENLSIGFDRYVQGRGLRSQRECMKVIDKLSISVHVGEIVAIVGASGSGKSLLADAIMGLYEPNAKVTGVVFFDGVQQDAAGLRALRGHDIAFVPQSVESLDPLMRVGDQIGGIKEQRLALYDRYRLDHQVDSLYPFQLSGGMARRVLLCTALVSNPKVIVADEPTPGLDLELAVQAMTDFRSFADDGGGVLLITHDIQLALRVADRIAVFRDGTVVEETSVSSFDSPDLLEHSFSKDLWHALPEHDFLGFEEGEGGV